MPQAKKIEIYQRDKKSYNNYNKEGYQNWAMLKSRFI